MSETENILGFFLRFFSYRNKLYPLIVRKLPLSGSSLLFTGHIFFSTNYISVLVIEMYKDILILNLAANMYKCVDI